MISVHIADVKQLSARTVHLTNGEVLEADTMVCATGYKHITNIKFFPDDLDKQLDIPHFSMAQNKLDHQVVAEADKVILDQFPSLREQPSLANDPEAYFPGDTVERLNRPYRLFRFIVPPAFFAKRNRAIIGMFHQVNTPLSAQVQCLWITAHFGGLLSLANMSRSDIEWQATLHNRFGRWRSPSGLGARQPDFVFDTLPYIELLLSDLKLKVCRKKNVFAEIFQAYSARDYCGLIDEWKLVHDEQVSLAKKKV
jgi:hypothetical protein